MIKKQTNHLLQFVAALALPLVAIGVGLQSCSDDGPGIPYTDGAEKESQVKNLLMRTPEEAIDIAQRAWEDFYGDESSTASRSGRRCVIDYGRPVEVVREAKSRGGSGSDTLLYVVNFVDDGGFAVIAAPPPCRRVACRHLARPLLSRVTARSGNSARIRDVDGKRPRLCFYSP